ncbi:thiol-disulfide oxidoreductase DCC family protein [Peribacillus loiseleuriae]|uniref:Thiol-disulfide oxidoreductase n=1 Tax=Peribacillus loiseleuriae TaxID=1679170 RepID=A0A0K9GVL2_9BACI|nr:thiol-disulfide oxidoreductase DCC family protein [Peribacillus loiseleuriae]KMY50297.1 thiol-disulfide oxidoreductase [Peribacillus loiseleuriae]
MKGIVLFDGECNFCDKSVQFIIKRDPKGYYNFASIQSTLGQDLLKKYNLDSNMDSFVLIEHNKAYEKSAAALRITKNLRWCWKFLYPLILVPVPFRNWIYGVIAKNRYKWFGKKDQCVIPSPEIRKRFLD